VLCTLPHSANMSTSLDDHLPHGTLLSDTLQRLQLESSDVAPNGDNYDNETDSEPRLSSPSSKSYRKITSVVHEGYGFRPASGASTPPKTIAFHGPDSPLPDRNGLGWPGEASAPDVYHRLPNMNLPKNILLLAKSTVSRLTATPAEKEARLEKLCSAVRVILECIGEDPDREGLVRTPERYAQALMWMTRGYEERLAGASRFNTAYALLTEIHSGIRCNQ